MTSDGPTTSTSQVGTDRLATGATTDPDPTLGSRLEQQDDNDDDDDKEGEGEGEARERHVELSLESLDKQELIALVEKLSASYDDSLVTLERLERQLEQDQQRRSRKNDSEEEDDDAEEERGQSETGNDGDGRRRIGELERELSAVKTREQGSLARLEVELSGHIEVVDKLRHALRDAERDRKDSNKRYREQLDSFEVERQSWTDQERHYKLTIERANEQALVDAAAAAARERALEPDLELDPDNDPEPGDVDDDTSSDSNPAPSTTTTTVPSTAQVQVPTGGPSAHELSLEAQLASLSTAYESVSTTLRTVQLEMTDLKRVYAQVQEENESYEILLGEKTLSGQVTGTEFFRKSFSWTGDGDGDEDHVGASWSGFGFQGGLEAVGEGDEDALGRSGESDGESETDSGSGSGSDDEDLVERVLLESHGVGTIDSGAVSTQPRRKRRNKSIALAHRKRDSSVALVGAGGGLDLAAELEAAQKDEGMDEVEAERKKAKEERKNRKREERERKKREARGARRDPSQSYPVGIEELHLEIKQLREANKALTLYVSKIVDRVCSQEGFEKVLAVDYRNNTTPKAASSSPPPSPPPAPPTASEAQSPGHAQAPNVPTKKARPVSTSFFSRASSTEPEPSTPKPLGTSTPSPAGLSATPSSASSIERPPAPNGPRRSGGLTWDGITSVFGFGSGASSSSSPATPSSTTMKPLMLSSNSSSTATDRRLSISDEDEDDMLERERLRLDMSKHGIEYAPTLAQIGRPLSSSSSSGPAPPGLPPSSSTPPPVHDELEPPELERDVVVEPKPRSFSSLEERAQERLRATALADEQLRQELQAGGNKSSSSTTTTTTTESRLTEPPPRRMAKLERRHSSRGTSYGGLPSSSSLNATTVAVEGLGIDSPSPVATNASVSPSEVGGGESTEEGGTGWTTKALRRMSRGWASPPVS